MRTARQIKKLHRLDLSNNARKKLPAFVTNCLSLTKTNNKEGYANRPREAELGEEESIGSARDL